MRRFGAFRAIESGILATRRGSKLGGCITSLLWYAIVSRVLMLEREIDAASRGWRKAEERR